MTADTAPLSLYVHWPWCRSKCPYCDFNSHAADAIDQRRWRDALVRELDFWADETAGRTVTSVFFGGGTPSLMEPPTVAAILESARARWTFADDLEVTLEANPTSAEAARFQAVREAGVNRVSLGVQALDDDALRFLGRGHSADEARDAVALAARTFPRVSFDLIYARPGQTVAAWRAELNDALGICGEHLSVYQLTIEPGTEFFRRAVAPANEDTAVALFETTEQVLGSAGLPAYEVSNHAKPGAECRHNLAIWRGADYVGVGPGAHGRLTRGGTTEATRAIRAPDKWLAAVETAGHGVAERVRLDPEERREELVMLGLRLLDGLDARRFRAATGAEPVDCVDAAALATLVDAGFVVLDSAGLRVTAAGRLRLDAVIGRLLA